MYYLVQEKGRGSDWFTIGDEYETMEAAQAYAWSRSRNMTYFRVVAYFTSMTEVDASTAADRLAN